MSVILRQGSKKSIPLMKALWKEVFGDSDAFIDMFFSVFYKPSKAYLAFDGEELVSMLFYMDTGLKYFKKSLKCAYLYGVATKASERSQGHFHLLHEKLLSDLENKRYDAVLVIPQSDSLASFYRELGYNCNIRRFEYRLLTHELEEVANPEEIWAVKKALHRRSSYGLSILETKLQFIHSREGHKFFRQGDTYFSFCPTKSGYRLYEALTPTHHSIPAERIHYEKSACLMDMTGAMDRELIEKQKPQLSFLLN